MYVCSTPLHKRGSNDRHDHPRAASLQRPDPHDRPEEHPRHVSCHHDEGSLVPSSSRHRPQSGHDRLISGSRARIDGSVRRRTPAVRKVDRYGRQCLGYRPRSPDQPDQVDRTGARHRLTPPGCPVTLHLAASRGPDWLLPLSYRSISVCLC